MHGRQGEGAREMRTIAAPQQHDARTNGDPDGASPTLWSPGQFSDDVPLRRPSVRRWIETLFFVNPSSGMALGYLDGIRAVAVLFVLIVHVWWAAGAPRIVLAIPFTASSLDLTAITAYTQNGVDLFFVLSGFLLAQQWIRADFQGRPRPSIRRYFQQRFLRIVPAYYACLFLILLFFTPKFIDPMAIYSQRGLVVLLAHLTFLHFALPVSAGSYGVGSPFWTLTIEMMFYLTLPWTVVFFARKRWMVALPTVIVLTIGWLVLARVGMEPVIAFYRTYLSPPGVPAADVRWILSKQLPGQFIHFALGMTFANLFVRHQLGVPSGRWFRIVTSHWAGKVYFLLGWGIAVYFMNKVSFAASVYGYSYEKLVNEAGAWFPYYFSAVPFAFAFALIIAGLSFGGPTLQGLFSFLPLRLIGVLGFSIYLWHMPVIFLFSSFPALAALPPDQRFPALLFACAAALLLLAGGFYLAVEKPFILRGRRRAHAASAANPVAAPVGMATSARTELAHD